MRVVLDLSREGRIKGGAPGAEARVRIRVIVVDIVQLETGTKTPPLMHRTTQNLIWGSPSSPASCRCDG